MARPFQSAKSLTSALVAFACVAVAAGGLFYVFGKHHSQTASDPEITASIAPIAAQLGPSGLPLPRFVSLKTEKVNVRKGPSSDHDVAWVYQFKGLPVEIIAEFETWRRVRDSEGTEGWVLQNLLAGKRTALIAPWKKKQLTPLWNDKAAQGTPVAQLSSGVMGEIESCDGKWCDIKTSGYRGYVDQALLWGAYPGEVVN
jgi:SH3-like domain-containing protein